MPRSTGLHATTDVIGLLVLLSAAFRASQFAEEDEFDVDGEEYDIDGEEFDIDIDEVGFDEELMDEDDPADD